MNRLDGLLAIGIEGRVDADGHLLAADPHLMHLHRANGGSEGGILAIPALLKIAKLCWRTGATFERAILAADEARDLELWVKVRRDAETVLLTISGWRERAHAIRTMPTFPEHFATARGAGSPGDILIDGQGHILRMSPELVERLGSKTIGRPFDEAFERLEASKVPAWIAAIDSPAKVLSIKTAQVFELTAVRRNDAEGNLLGFALNCAEVEEEQQSLASENAGRPEAGFGRHFASAVRQPLSRIIANAETIRSTLNGPLQDNYTAYAQDIAVAARHLSELIGDLEDLDAIDRVDFKVAAEKVELGDIARRVGGLLALKAADHHIRIVLPEPQLIVETTGEFRRVLQIVLNLVGNAIRYTPGGSSVFIRLTAEPPSLSVEDEGAGIPEDERERIFEKFERLGRTGGGGSGLGLYISRRLARAMHGDLTVSESEQGGAKFTLTLPPYRSV